MGQKIVTLRLPDELYESAQAAVDAVGRSVETVRLESIDVMFRMNRDRVVRARERWVKAGWHPPIIRDS